MNEPTFVGWYMGCEVHLGTDDEKVKELFSRRLNKVMGVGQKTDKELDQEVKKKLGGYEYNSIDDIVTKEQKEWWKGFGFGVFFMFLFIIFEVIKN